MPLHTFSIDEAEISLFPVDSEGRPITDSPLWLGAAAQHVEITEALEELEDRPSGSAHPVVHHGAELHEITLGRIWELQVPIVDHPENLAVTLATDLPASTPAANGNDYRLRPGQEYVLVIQWEDEDDPQRFHWRVYYGVTDRSYNLSGDSAEDNQAQHRWRAKYYLT